MIAVIMAGGKGTRLQSIYTSIPKPMVPINGRPILENQIFQLKKYGIKDFILVIGYLGNVIKDYFGNGEKLGINVSYIEEASPLGSGGALYYLKDTIKEDFLLIFGDIIFNIDWYKAIQFHKDKKGLITLFAHPNSHPYDSDLILTDYNNQVIGIDSKGNVRNYFYKNLVNAGLYICSSKILNNFEEVKKLDFEKEVMLPLINNHFVYAYKTSEYIKDAGTPDRYETINIDLNNHIDEDKNLFNMQKAIFLDRDGTINKYNGFIKNTEDFSILDGVASVIKKINNSKYLAIVITNQPVISRGECTYEELDMIHKKLETQLGKEGAYIDAIYYCPHHPDSGFKNEIKELKIDCDCRKPKTGLLLKAKEDFNIDLAKSYFIGDSKIDVQTGNNANCLGSYQIKTDDVDELRPIVNKIISN